MHAGKLTKPPGEESHFSPLDKYGGQSPQKKGEGCKNAHKYSYTIKGFDGGGGRSRVASDKD